MAAHRKPRRRSAGGNTARTAWTIALAGAATATGFDGTGHAEPQLTPAQVKAKVDKLYQEAEAATEKYNGAKEQADAGRQRIRNLQDQAARKTEKLNSAREALGSMAAAQYRDGGLDPALQLALSEDPDRYLDGAEFAERAGNRQASSVASVRKQLREIEQLRGAAQVELTSLKSRQAELKRHKKTITGKLDSARDLLTRLTAEEQARLGDRATRSSTGARDSLASPVPPPPRPPTPARRPPSPTPTPNSAAPTSGARPAPTPSTAPASRRPHTARPASRCPARPTPRSTRAVASRAPNCGRATWCSSTPASATWACTSATAR